MNDEKDGAPGATPTGTNGHPQQGGTLKTGGSRAQERIDALDTKGAASAARIDELSEQLEAALRRADEAEAGWQRARADFANLKRRSDEERMELTSLAGDRLLSRVLDIADDFDLAVEHVPDDARGSPWVEGISAIDRKLRALLEMEGVTAMEGEGEPFDPHTQQAISYEDSTEVPDGTVIKVLQRGYVIRDRVLRPALVAVARNDAAPSTTDD